MPKNFFLKKPKSPGSDGFTADSLKKIKYKVSDFVVRFMMAMKNVSYVAHRNKVS